MYRIETFELPLKCGVRCGAYDSDTALLGYCWRIRCDGSSASSEPSESSVGRSWFSIKQPRSSKLGTIKTVKARFCLERQGKSPCNVPFFFLVARKRVARGHPIAGVRSATPWILRSYGHPINFSFILEPVQVPVHDFSREKACGFE